MKLIPWEKIGEPKKVADAYGKSFERQEFKDHLGKNREFFFFEGIPWSQVFAMTSEGKVIMVRQFKQGSNSIMEEIPGGSMGAGEDPKMVAERELKEETGFESGRIVDLEKFFLDSRSSHTAGHLFFADNCLSTADQDLDSNEQVEVFLISLNEYVRRIVESKDGFRTEALALLRSFPYLRFRHKMAVIFALVRNILL